MIRGMTVTFSMAYISLCFMLEEVSMEQKRHCIEGMTNAAIYLLICLLLTIQDGNEEM